MNTYILQIDRNDEQMKWEHIPDTLWKAILSEFVNSHADGVGFDGVASSKALSKMLGLFDWHQKEKFKCDIHTVFRNRKNIEISLSYRLSVFSYSIEIKNLLSNARFDQWQSFDEKYSTDHLFFFSGKNVILEVTPYENTIVFHLTRNQYSNLIQIDTLIQDHLYQSSSDRVTTVNVIS